MLGYADLPETTVAHPASSITVRHGGHPTSSGPTVGPV
jgi:hypothetical protein